MRVLVVVAFLGIAVHAAIALPSYELQEGRKSEDFTDISDSKTVSALSRFFTPMIDWFRNELPKKTPQDLGNDVKNAAKQVKEWAADNKFIQGMKNAFQPIHQWVKDTGNTLKDKSFSDMYGDTKEVASRVDDNVGDWIDKRV